MVFLRLGIRGRTRIFFLKHTSVLLDYVVVVVVLPCVHVTFNRGLEWFLKEWSKSVCMHTEGCLWVWELFSPTLKYKKRERLIPDLLKEKVHTLHVWGKISPGEKHFDCSGKWGKKEGGQLLILFTSVYFDYFWYSHIIILKHRFIIKHFLLEPRFPLVSPLLLYFASVIENATLILIKTQHL